MNIMDVIHDWFVLYSRKSNWYATRQSIRFMRQYFKDRPVIGAEIGVQHGANSLTMLKNLNITKMYLIDPYTWYDEIDGPRSTKHNRNESDAHRRMRPFGDRIVFVKKFSHEAVDNIKAILDFVYIDGNHYHKYIKQDLSDYYPLIRDGGIICGHDFDLPEVASAVTEFASTYGFVVNVQGHPGDWWMIKKEVNEVPYVASTC